MVRDRSRPSISPGARIAPGTAERVAMHTLMDASRTALRQNPATSANRGASNLYTARMDCAAILNDLSVVIPAYNEAGRIARTLRDLHEFCAARSITPEIVVVDDGSTDSTPEVVARQTKEVSQGDRGVRLVSNDANRGKGFSLRRGIDAATHAYVLLMDADGSTPLTELNRLAGAVARGAEFAIGSRDMPDSRLLPPQPWARRVAATAFRGLRRLWMLPQIHDTQCGFKLVQRAAALAALAHCREERWLLDCELLAVADRLGYRIAEVGVEWRNDPATHVSAAREVLVSLIGLVRIRRSLSAIPRRRRPRQSDRS